MRSLGVAPELDDDAMERRMILSAGPSVVMSLHAGCSRDLPLWLTVSLIYSAPRSHGLNGAPAS
jgi:hypothetical protein